MTNCHPFRHGRWLFVHNGFIADFTRLRRDLMFSIDQERFPEIEGSTDSEIVFQLALTFGLEHDPIEALERTVGLIEADAERRRIDAPVQATFGVSDGSTLWAVRYASAGRARSLFESADVENVHRLYPDNPRFKDLRPDDRLIVSEPFSDLPGLWREIPEATAVTVGAGGIEQRSFQPRRPAASRRPSVAHA
jgi:glutamine amidotransferase